MNGSHHVYGQMGEAARLSVPLHGSRPLEAGLLRHLAKLAGLPDSELR